MKLLNCRSLEIEEHYGSSIPKRYAILSHTWESGEASFQDVGNTEAMASKPGWAKIKQTCRRALEQGYSFAWIDTCCIDKTNLTELTEAINSMFKWYERSEICYAYLSDIRIEETQKLQESRWFTRGWTLQELIAPRQVEFYDKDWKFPGTRADLSDDIEKRTGIGKDFLTNTTDPVEDMLPEIPIARRMSWAADRTTTREEDLAYCLLGIFGVNMPLLYGEGSRAFIRLQEELIREAHDTSIFAWSHPKTVVPGQPRQLFFGILATSPSMFTYAKTLERAPEKTSVEYTMTNKGLRIETEVFGAQYDWQEMSMELGCRLQDDDESENLCVLLWDQGDGTMVRSNPYIHKVSSQLRAVNPKPNVRLLIRKHLNQRQSRALESCHGSIFVHDYVRGHDSYVYEPVKLQFIEASPPELWDSGRSAFLTQGLRSFYGFIRFKVVVFLGAGSTEWNSMGQDFILATWFSDGGCLDQPSMCLVTSTERSELYNAVMARDRDEREYLCRQQYEPPARVWLKQAKIQKSQRFVDRVKARFTDNVEWRFSVSLQVSTILGILRNHTVMITVHSERVKSDVS